MHASLQHTVATYNGLFGQIEIYDLAGRRWFKNNGVLQSSVFLTPGTETVPGLGKGQPGPVQNCTYTLAWLMAAAASPEGRGLMLGLGGGEGPVSILYHFPFVSLTIVEIDPAVIAAVRAHYPVFRYYEQQGRLTIHEGCARRWVRDNNTVHDFAIFDIDDMHRGAHEFLTYEKFLASLRPVARHHWFNLIGRREHASTAAVLHALGKAGFRNLGLYSCQPRTMNLIITNRPPGDAEKRLEPYAAVDHECALGVQAKYRGLVASWTELEERVPL